MKIKDVLLLGCIVLIFGCGYIDQNLMVAPQVSVTKNNIGKGKKIALRIVDDRDDQLIGHRVGDYGMKGAKISTGQDLVEILRNSFVENLKNIGFEPVGENDDATILRVELRSLSYDTAMGLWTGGNIGKSIIKIVGTNSANKTYEKSYHGQKEIRTVFVGSQETNAKVVNEALAETLNKIFEDRDLWNFLVQ